MSHSSIAGIIFTNVHDELMENFTAHRSMASIPFGGRYRLIDFPLSNLVNAGVTNVGLVIKEKYRSLLDHVGSGVAWDLDRKHGGLHLMPPYNTSGAKRYNGYIESLYGAMDFVNRCNAEYIVTYNSDVVANVDIDKVLKSHIKNNADITVVYTNGIRSSARDDEVELKFDNDGRLSGFEASTGEDKVVDYSISIMLFSKKVLCDNVKQAYIDNELYIDDIIEKFRVFGYKHNGFSAVMNGQKDYYDANMKLLESEVRKDLFCKERPILTKTRDDMPTRYGTQSIVNNSIIADGCVIEGTVKNSVLFRGVKVEKGAVIENSIIMQGAYIGANTTLDYVISDKNAKISNGITIKGTAENTFFIRKNQAL